jgi:hypothetical protein
VKSRQLGPRKLKEASSPVLQPVSVSPLLNRPAQLTGQSPPC